MTRSRFDSTARVVLAITAALVTMVTSAAAQTAPEPAAEPQEHEVERADPDARVDPLQPDFNLAALPTTLRMPRHKWAFRITHRFTRPLDQGEFGDLLSDFFGFDSSANVGLELRFGLFRGTQLGVHRTSDRTIQLFAQHSILTERDGARFGLDALVALEGQRNMRGEHQGAFGVITSKRIGRSLAVYAEPIVVTNANPFGSTDDTTLLLGLGGRLRVLRSMYLLGEITPRLIGVDMNVNQMSFAVELRPGGHLFQINVSNGWGTTIGQLTRGGITHDNWYLGFNISRKFF